MSGALTAGLPEIWVPVATDLAAEKPERIVKWGRKVASRVLPKRAGGILEARGLHMTAAMLGALAQNTGPDEQWFVHRPSLPEDILTVRVRWFPGVEVTDASLRDHVGADPTDKIVVADEQAATAPDGSAAWTSKIASGPEQASGFITAFRSGTVLVQARLQVPRPALAAVRDDAERLIGTLRIA
jgi:hypothetical protein